MADDRKRGTPLKWQDEMILCYREHKEEKAAERTVWLVDDGDGLDFQKD